MVQWHHIMLDKNNVQKLLRQDRRTHFEKISISEYASTGLG